MREVVGEDEKVVDEDEGEGEGEGEGVGRDELVRPGGRK